MPEQINAVSTRLPDFAQNEPLTWFRKAETRFRIRGIVQPTTRADYVLEALPETIFARIGPWLNQQPDEIKILKIASLQMIVYSIEKLKIIKTKLTCKEI